MTPGYSKAYATGTRDSSGAPGRRYWQQKVDYRIEATVDPATNQVRGRETISLHNTTPDTLKTIVIRLYQNYFSPSVERSAYVTDITDGMTVERIAVNGAPVTLSDSKQYELRETIATITPSVADSAWSDCDDRSSVAVHRFARRHHRARAADGSFRQLSVSGGAMVSTGRDVRRHSRLGHGSVPWQRRVQQSVRVIRREDHRARRLAARRDRSTSRIPEAVYSKRTRDRLALAMQVDTTVLVVEAKRAGRLGHCAGVDSHVAFHRADGERFCVRCLARLRVRCNARGDAGEGNDSDQCSLPPAAHELPDEQHGAVLSPGASRSTRSFFSRTSSRRERLPTGRRPEWNTR